MSSAAKSILSVAWFCVMASAAYTYWGLALFNQPINFKRFCKIYAAYICICIVRNVVFFSMPACSFAMGIVSMLAVCWWGYGMHGWKLIYNSMLMFAMGIATEAIAMPIITNILNIEETMVACTEKRFEAWSSYIMYVTHSAVYVIMTLIGGLIHIVRIHWVGHASSRAWYLIRPVLLAVVALVAGMLCWQRLVAIYASTLGDSTQIFIEIFINYVIIAMLLLLGGSYIVQDIKFFKLYKHNETLQQQQRIYDGLLRDTRGFRHNIVNLLYGFAGELRGGDAVRIENYYKDMARTCVRINNENVASIERIPSQAVKTLLLGKLQHASENELPLYLYVQQDIHWCGIKEAKICQILGTLIDNAAEATAQAVAPYVGIEFSNVGMGMEILIRNTFDAEKCELTFLAGAAHSNRAGHEGLGIYSARKLMAQTRGAVMNQFQSGRYIETTLLFEQ